MAQPRGRACFCLSKARDGGYSDAGERGAASHRLRSELEGLKLSALRSRAKASGATADEIRAACDADGPETALIELILAQEEQEEGAATELGEELEALKLGALEGRAQAAGATDAQIEAAYDAEDSKAAMIDLILAREQPPGRAGGGAALRAALAGVTSLRYVSTGALNLVRAFTAESWSKKCFQEKPH